MKRWMKVTGVLVGVALAFVLLGMRSDLCVRHYVVELEGLTSPVRIALIADLHSCDYGEGQRELAEAIDAEAPDLVLLAGDFFDDVLPDNNAETLLEALGGRFPCYYVTGNHEYWAGSAALAKKLEIVGRCGAVNLGGKLETVTVRGQALNLCGLDDPHAFGGSTLAEREAGWMAQLEAVAAMDRGGRPTFLLSHRPEYFECYADRDFDLVLAGHAHGGQWRIPGLLNGLYAPGQGWFPKYAGGIYRRGDATMVVSRGLARESTRLPRFCNPPELVIVELR